MAYEHYCTVHVHSTVLYSKLWNKAQGLDALGGCFALAAVEETSAVL